MKKEQEIKKHLISLLTTIISVYIVRSIIWQVEYGSMFSWREERNK